MPGVGETAAAARARQGRAFPMNLQSVGARRWWPPKLARLQLVELEDLPWWPSAVRDFATDALHFLQTRLGLYRVIVPLLADAVRGSGVRHLVDLCSGAGGPLPAIVDELRREGLQVTAVLSDGFPNRDAFARVAAESAGAISFEAKPVDARSVPGHLRGLRTLFNAFHHFPPDAAADVLRAARDAGQPIAVFEFPDRNAPAILRMLAVPLLVWLTAPFMRPWSGRRLLWTYLIPLVPLTCFWDGVVSHLRAYRPGELQALADSIGPGFGWQVGRVRIGRVPGHLTYLIGLPDRAPRA